MKKLFIAALATGLGSQAAVAEIAFSGYGRFGVIYDEGNADETRLEQRFRLNIDGRAVSDNGLEFAGRLRVQSDDNSSGSAGVGTFNGARFQVGYEGLRLQVGNISGVFDDESTVLYFGYEPGLIGQVGQYSTFQGPIVEYESTGAGVTGVSLFYETGNLAVMASYNEDHDQDEAIENAFSENTEVGIAYDLGPVTLAAAYGTADDGATQVDYYVINAYGALGDLDYSIFVGDDDVGNEISYGVSGQYQVGAATRVIASIAAGGADDLEEAYGIGVRHDLGGGISLRGMVGQNEDGDTVADLGARFDF